MLLIADEVITGFGRTGRWLGDQRYGIEPDMITFAKGVTSGYMPLGGVLVGERVRAPFWDDDVPGAVFRHGYTYSGHAGRRAGGDGEPRHHRAARGSSTACAALEPVLDASCRRLEASPGSARSGRSG